jgi:hypothetical protein
MMQKANVGQGNTKMGKMVRRKELPYVHRLRSLYRDRIGSGAVLLSAERKKVMKKHRRSERIGLAKKGIICSLSKSAFQNRDSVSKIVFSSSRFSALFFPSSLLIH